MNPENWEAFIEFTRFTNNAVLSLGGTPHLWSVRVFGDRKRVLVINYFPENIGPLQTAETYSNPEVMEW